MAVRSRHLGDVEGLIGQICLQRHIPQHKAAGAVREAPIVDAGLTNGPEIGQGSAQLAFQVDMARQFAIAADQQIPEGLDLAISKDAAAQGLLAIDGDAEGAAEVSAGRTRSAWAFRPRLLASWLSIWI